MSNNYLKNTSFIKIILFLSFLFIVSCSSMEVQQNESDFFENAMVSNGNTLNINKISLTDRIRNMVSGDSNAGLKTGITFEVALDQFSVMPLLSVDRIGGVIITDWYSTSSNTNERVKFNIIIKDEMMESDSIDIKMFKETYNGSIWISSKVTSDTTMKIKDLILEKSKQLQVTAKLS